MTLQRALEELGALAKKWRDDATERRKVWADDPVASAFMLAAAELAEETKVLAMKGARISTSEYAELRGVKPQTVTRWIRRGYLEAVPTSNGYSIAAGARVVRGRAA